MTQDKDVREAVKETRIEAIQMLRKAGAHNGRIFELFQEYYYDELSDQDIRDLMEEARPQLTQLTYNDLDDDHKELFKEFKEKYGTSDERILKSMSKSKREVREDRLYGSIFMNWDPEAKSEAAEPKRKSLEDRDEHIKYIVERLRKSGADETSIFKILEKMYGTTLFDNQIYKLMNETK